MLSWILEERNLGILQLNFLEVHNQTMSENSKEVGWIVFRALSYSSEMERDHREPELALGEKLLKLDRDQQKYEIEAFIKGF